MVDIDATPTRQAATGKNEPEDRFEFWITAFKVELDELLDDKEGLGKWLAYKPVYDEQRPVLKDDVQVARATELAKEVGAYLGPKGKIFTLYKKHVKPLEDALAKLKRMRDGACAPGDQFDGELRGRINVYQQTQRTAALKKQAQEQAKAVELAKTGEPEKVQEAAAILSKPVERAGTVRSEHGAQAGYAIVFEIQSIMDDELPRELMSPDLGKIRAKIKTMTDEQKKTPFFIPGVVLAEKIQTRLT